MRNGPYILIVPPVNYPGKLYRNRYAYEHQVVYWKNYNQLAPKDYVIHHKNHDKHDNNIDNLELLLMKEHSKLHSKKAKIIELKCSYCGNIFMKRARAINPYINKGQKRFYCCQKHGGYATRKFPLNSLVE